MRKWLCAMLGLVLAAMCLTGCGEKESRLEQIQKRGTLIVATSPDFAPMEFQDLSSGETVYAGSDIELAKYIAQQLGVELEIKAMDFDSVKTAVTMGTADLGISGLSWREDRAESMELSDFYNLNESGGGHGILVPEGAVYTKAEDFSGKTVAAQNGSLQQSLVESQLPEDVELKLVGSLNDAVLMLQSGKVDAVAVDVNNGQMLVQNNTGLVLSEFVFNYKDTGNVIGIMKGETELLEAVNEILTQVNEQGLYSQWKDAATEQALALGLAVGEE